LTVQPEREQLIADLNERARHIRGHVVRIAAMSDCHTGGSLSMADMLAAMYFHTLKVDPQDPKWEGRDYVVLSKGHTVPGLDAALAERGFFDEALLTTHLELDSIISGHASTRTPGIDVSTGALGHGLPIGAGAALGIKADGTDNKVFVILGDGELQEGSNWEAAMCAAHHKLDNLVAIVDRNWYQTGYTEEMMALEPLDAKFGSFGWATRVIDGHDMAQVVDTLDALPFEAGKPSCIISRTIKGKGVSICEDGHCHMNCFSTEEATQALADLGFEA
jgi:transketolase